MGPSSLAKRRATGRRRHSAALRFIRPGHSVENCYFESFNGKLRDEFLSLHHFASLREVQARVETWRVKYNVEGLHRG